MNDSKQKNQVAKVQIDEPTGLMGTQFALNIAQGVLDAIEEVGVTKTQMLGWDQKELRLLSKKATQKFLGLKSYKVFDSWIQERFNITFFYQSCFGSKWIPNWERVKFPELKGVLKRPEFIFAETMTEDDALDAYIVCFGKDSVCKEWNDKLTKVINRKTVQIRPKQNYVMLHVGGGEPDLLNKSYDDGISENIIFMTPLEGIISAFRYRFETGKMYDVIGGTRLSAFDRYGYTLYMGGDTGGEFGVVSDDRDARSPGGGLRQVCF